MRDSGLSPTLLVAHCRAGFEPEAASRSAAGLRRRSATDIDVDAPVGRGFVVGSLARFDPRSWPRAFERAPPIFVRSLFFGTGPHALFDRRDGRRPARSRRAAGSV